MSTAAAAPSQGGPVPATRLTASSGPEHSHKNRDSITNSNIGCEQTIAAGTAPAGVQNNAVHLTQEDTVKTVSAGRSKSRKGGKPKANGAAQSTPEAATSNSQLQGKELASNEEADVSNESAGHQGTHRLASKRGSKGRSRAQVIPLEAAIDGGQGKEVTVVKTHSKTPGRKRRVAAAEQEVGEAATTHPEVPPKRGRRKARPVVNDAADGKVEEEEQSKDTPVKKRRAKRENDPLPFTDPTSELLSSLADYKPSPLPVPNLGYACLNMTLRSLKPPIFTSRDLIKRTLDTKGLPYLGELCLANCRDLPRLIQWNQEQGIRLFRMSSVLLPWMGTFDITELPNYNEVASALHCAGDLARAYGQRLTFHPSHFVKLAAPVEDLVQRSINDLEAHSQILDLMGYKPSHWNKINIHVGGQYGSKEESILRFAENFKRLSPACQARLTVENDDIATSYSLEDLLELHKLTGIPLVFDFHHHRFCPGSLSEKEALFAAVATWPKGVRPVVHWSESQEGRKPHAHSDYVKGPILLHGLEGEVDVMIEAKCKEQALLCYRDGLPIPDLPPVEEPPLTSEDAVALKLL